MYLKIIKEFFKEDRTLEDGGERIEIILDKNCNVDYGTLDMYQKSHLKRYELAQSVANLEMVIGDFACGTGYGTAMLGLKARNVTGIDINKNVIDKISKRYSKFKNLKFVHKSLTKLDFNGEFDLIISFETVEHLEEVDIKKVFKLFNKSLKKNGELIFSVPYMQEKSDVAINLGFHLTFYINEEKLESWLKDAGFEVKNFKYQNYDTHVIENSLEKKDFIICTAIKV
jgi:2-polyprenyl-3-methyl-5-hydroxy-6-metoxy-1,4-benzoquinol methylase